MKRHIITVTLLGLALVGCTAGATESTSTPVLAEAAVSTAATPPYDLSITVQSERGVQASQGGECVAVADYRTNRVIAQGGSQITIKDAAGKVVGIGNLDPGAVDGDDAWSDIDKSLRFNQAPCIFTAAITDIDSSAEFYTLQVVGMTINLNADEMATGKVGVRV